MIEPHQIILEKARLVQSVRTLSDFAARQKISRSEWKFSSVNNGYQCSVIFDGKSYETMANSKEKAKQLLSSKIITEFMEAGHPFFAERSWADYSFILHFFCQSNS